MLPGNCLFKGSLVDITNTDDGRIHRAIVIQVDTDPDTDPVNGSAVVEDLVDTLYHAARYVRTVVGWYISQVIAL